MTSIDPRPRFVTLTDSDGEPIVVNPQQVSVVRTARHWNCDAQQYEPRGARVGLVGMDCFQAVRETAAQVLDLLTGQSDWQL